MAKENKKEEITTQTEPEQPVQEEALPEQEPNTSDKVGLPEVLTKPEEKEETKADTKDFCDAEFFYLNIFKPAFKIGAITSGYETLEIIETEEAGARATSNELFKLIEETPSLNFLRRMDWIERYSLVFLFVYQKGSAVWSEYKQKHPKNTINAEYTDVSDKQSDKKPEDKKEKPEEWSILG